MTFITKHNIVFLILPCVLAFFLFSYIPKVENVENVDQFIIQDDPENLYYKDFKKIFGNDEFFLIAFKTENIFTKANLALLKNITREIENIEEVKDVKSLANIDETIGYQDYFEVRPFLGDIPKSRKELNDLKNRAVSNPLYIDNFISQDGRTAAIAVEAYEKPDDYGYRFRLLDKTQEVLDKYESQSIKFHLAGKTITDTTMSRYMEKDMSLLIPLSYLLITLSIYYFFRNIYLTILGIVNISFCLGSTMGFMGFFSITQNSVTSIVLPLIMALSLCDTVHIFSRLTSDELFYCGFGRRKAMTSVLNKNLKPCFYTSLTTGAGFLSLMTSRLVPIEEFAIAAAAGIVFEFIFSFTLLPSLILLFKPEKIYGDYDKKSFVKILLDFTAELVVKRKKGILAAGVIIFILSVFSAGFIKIETNITEFFKADSSFRKSLEFIESELSGIESFDISVKAGYENAFKEPEKLKLIEKIENFVSDIDGVDKTVSFNNFIKDMNKSFHNEDPLFYRIPDSKNLIAQYLLLYDSDDIDDYINSYYDHARILVRISEHNSSSQAEIIKKVKKFADLTEIEDVEITVTGRVVQDVNVINEIFIGQVKSLGLAVLIIWGLLFFVFRSFLMGIVSFVPNIYPIVFNFGVMGILGIPLNTATALISAVAIGIAVDDTIHFLTDYKSGENMFDSSGGLVKSVIYRKGPALISSSFILAIGFGILVLSSFIPTVQFGFLCAVIMLAAIFADLLILPSFLLFLKKD